MPRGITDQFLRILENERRESRKTTLWMAGLFVVAYFMAELTDHARFGGVVLLVGAALVSGLALGAVLAWRKTTRYGALLRDSWNEWMRKSLACTRLDDLARHVQQKAKPFPFTSVGWAVLLLANVALFVALWVEVWWAVAFGVLVTAANGLVLGGLVGAAVWQARWAKQFTRAVDELVTEGQIGVWGEV